MNNTEYRERVYHAIRNKPWLVPIFTSSHEIPERLREINPDLFLVRNLKHRRYEVHNLSHKDGNTYGFVVPYPELDVRTVKLARENDLRSRGEEIFNEMDRWNEMIEREAKRKRSDELRGDVAEKMYDSVSKLAWEGA